jgi:hypothetical protein
MTETVAGFFGGGNPSAKFPTISTTIAGRITAVHPPEDQTDFETRLPVPGKKQVRIELATELRDPDIADDDGARVLYVRGWMTGAIGDALRKAGAAEPTVGGRLAVTYIGDGPPTRPGLKGPKLYAATYAPAPKTGGFFANGGPVAGSASSADDRPAGFTAADWHAMPEAARAAVRTMHGAGVGATLAADDEPPF